MKVSFSIPSKASSSSERIKLNNDPSTSSSKNDAAPSKQFINEFDPSKPPTLDQQPSIIPPIQNEWPPMKNLALQFEQESSQGTVEPGADMSYGLNLRQSAKKDGENGDDGDRAPRQREAEALQRLKDDLKRLPEDRGLEEFEDVPVEGFGKAVLGGYGWSEGMGIGKKAKEDVKVVQLERRTGKEGLGFVADDRSRSKKKEEVRVKVDDVAELGSVQEERCLSKFKDLKLA